jgi:hypothetical protein
MAYARRTTSGSPPSEDGWQLVARRKQWCWMGHQAPPPQPPRRPVPVDLVGRCFNCFGQDHVAADCPNATQCLQCHREGHSAWACKRPPPPPLSRCRQPSTTPQVRFSRCGASTALGDVALVQRRLPPW